MPAAQEAAEAATAQPGAQPAPQTAPETAPSSAHAAAEGAHATPPPSASADNEERKKKAAQIKKEKKKAARQAENGRKGAPWTEAEHVAFLAGLRKFGKGNWRAIARCYVPSRTPTQVASHAQKHYLRVQGATKRKSRFTEVEQACAAHMGGALPGPESHAPPFLADLLAEVMLPPSLSHLGKLSPPALEAAYVEYMVMCQLRWSAMVSGSAHHRANCAAASEQEGARGGPPAGEHAAPLSTEQQHQQHAAYLALAAQQVGQAAAQGGGGLGGAAAAASGVMTLRCGDKLPLAPLARRPATRPLLPKKKRKLAPLAPKAPASDSETTSSKSEQAAGGVQIQAAQATA